MPHPYQPQPQQALLIIDPIAMPTPKEMIAVAARSAVEYPGTTTGAP